MPDGALLKVRIDGAGADIVLVSGLGGTAAFWEPINQALRDRFRIIRFDQRGIGDSTRGTAPCTIDQLAADTLRILEEMDISSTLVVGHSTGGAIVQTLAAKTPERLSGLVLSATWLKPSRYMHELFRLRRMLLEQQPAAYAAIGLFLGYPPQWIDAHWDVFDLAVAARGDIAVLSERIEALLAFDASDSVHKIEAPILIVGANDDQVVPCFLQQELAKVFPRANTHTFPSGGHFFPVTEPEAFSRLLAGWADMVARR
jgi:aminoacrylate hydrolase